MNAVSLTCFTHTLVVRQKENEITGGLIQNIPFWWHKEQKKKVAKNQPVC